MRSAAEGLVVDSLAKTEEARTPTEHAWDISTQLLHSIASTVLTLIAPVTPTGMFWFYGLFAILGIVFVLRWVPETKGKTLEEVSDELANRAA